MTLTCTHSFFVPRLVRAEVTVQSFVVVTGIGLIAHFAHLSGTGLTAVTAVHQETDSGRAAWGPMGTFTRPLTELRPVVGVCDRCGGRHGTGILGVGLQRGTDKPFYSPVEFCGKLKFIHSACWQNLISVVYH